MLVVPSTAKSATAPLTVLDCRANLFIARFCSCGSVKQFGIENGVCDSDGDNDDSDNDNDN